MREAVANKSSDIHHEYCQFCDKFVAFQTTFGENAERMGQR